MVAGLQQRYPGLRPVSFWSPYEAAPQFGEPVTFGYRLRALPPGQALAQLKQLPGIGDSSP